MRNYDASHGADMKRESEQMRMSATCKQAHILTAIHLNLSVGLEWTIALS